MKALTTLCVVVLLVEGLFTGLLTAGETSRFTITPQVTESSEFLEKFVKNLSAWIHEWEKAKEGEIEGQWSVTLRREPRLRSYWISAFLQEEGEATAVRVYRIYEAESVDPTIAGRLAADKIIATVIRRRSE